MTLSPFYLSRMLAAASMGVKHLEKVGKGNHEGRLLGDDDFADEAMRKSGQGRMRQVRIEEIMELVSDIYSISCTDLGRPGKDSVFAEARAVAAWLIRDSEHLSVTEFGRLVGRDISSLCQGINRLLKRAESDVELKGKMQQVQLRSGYPQVKPDTFLHLFGQARHLFDTFSAID